MSVPKLRFEEFQNSWKIFRLEEIASVERGKFSVRPRNDPKYFGGHLPFIQTGDVSNANIFVKNYSQTLNYAGIEVSRVFPEGTILITIAANIGDTAITQFQVACPDSLVGINPNTNITNTYFLKYVLDLSKETLDSQATQNAQKNINLQILRPLPCCLPVLEEQTKIATFLFAVDEKIAQLSRKHELLLQYKQGMMQQLFSQKLRFKDDRGEDFPEWGNINLGSISKIFKGKSVSKSDISNNGSNFCIRYGEIYTQYGQVINNVISKTDIAQKDSILSQEGDVLIPASGESQIDIATAVCIMKSDVILGGDINILRHNQDGRWLAYYLTFAKKLEIAQLAQGNSVVHLYGKQLENLRIQIPCQTEQFKIANFLESIDLKLNVLEQKIKQAREWKQGLLQQMFV